MITIKNHTFHGSFESTGDHEGCRNVYICLKESEVGRPCSRDRVSGAVYFTNMTGPVKKHQAGSNGRVVMLGRDAVRPWPILRRSFAL